VWGSEFGVWGLEFGIWDFEIMGFGGLHLDGVDDAWFPKP
jgi:hypothetical protein